ncbi:MAG: 1-deoxy-D-xylulose-5-phosphate reductoisomerase [Spirochaetales bacterium]|nr:1-deoxy-D-xylulose-5-phosphate reductoisomerase [Spirochaetales bacterium]
MKKIIILGSTGSIGENTLDVIRNHRDSFIIVGLSCHTRVAELLAQTEEFKPRAIAITGPGTELEFTGFPGKIYKGEAGLLDMIVDLDADIVVNGISGAKGLLPSFRAIESGKDCALANKETIVMAGPLFLRQASHLKRCIVPVDSEHSGLFQLLQQLDKKRVAGIIITASGGAFRCMPKEKLHTVTVEDALKHPTWNMGKKITIDSATLGNKGLEVIEAHYLFSMPLSKIKVVIHPQSLVHSLARTIDGCLFAQVSEPDMRMPIHYALFYPDATPSEYGTLDLAGKEFSFYPVDEEKYGMLSLAYRAAGAGEAYPVVYNAANEIAVEAFISGQIPFTGIPYIVERALEKEWEKIVGSIVGSIEDILAFDKAARRVTHEILLKIGRNK